jgi:hypothetical protein
MPDLSKLPAAFRKEAERVEEDSIHSAKSHFNAADIWKKRNYWLGIPATILSAAAGAAILKDCQELAGGLSLLAAIFTALLTFLKPSEQASQHKTVADQYLALRNDARIFREIELLEDFDEKELSEKLKNLGQRRNELNQSSPVIPRKAFKQARDGINQGETQYKTDKEV